MPISFANIPANIKVPLYWVEVDPSMAGLPSINLRALLVGTMTADGTAPHDIPVPIGSQAQADHAFGPGSELSRMFKAFFANNFANEVWGLPMAETVAASAATGPITITTAPTAAGTIHLYISGDKVPVNVALDGHRRRDRGRDRGSHQREPGAAGHRGCCRSAW